MPAAPLHVPSSDLTSDPSRAPSPPPSGELPPALIAATDTFLAVARAHQVHAAIRGLSGGPGPEGCYQSALRQAAAAEKAARFDLERAVLAAAGAVGGRDVAELPAPVGNAIDALADAAHEAQVHDAILALRAQLDALHALGAAPTADEGAHTDQRAARDGVTAARLAFEQHVRELLERPVRERAARPSAPPGP